MFFDRIEREITDGEPWARWSLNHVKSDDSMCDFWQIKSGRKHTIVIRDDSRTEKPGFFKKPGL